MVLLTVSTAETPHVADQERFTVEPLGQGFFRIAIRYGFMEDPNIPAVLARIQAPGLGLPPADTTYFLGKETILATYAAGGVTDSELAEIGLRVAQDEKFDVDLNYEEPATAAAKS